jgi:osmotically-inducible protein OsmY
VSPSLAKDVLDLLTSDESINSSRINVVAKDDNTVVLSGVVSSFYEKTEAAEDAWRTTGVRSVNNEIVVDTDAERVLDEDLAARAIAGLDANRLVPKGAVVVTVDDGYITLAGNVDHYFQRQAAEHVIRHLDGLRGMVDRLTVSGNAAMDVATNISESMQRNAALDASKITVYDQAGVVTLTGNVRSYAERLEAERAASRSSGVTSVVNDLTVSA